MELSKRRKSIAKGQTGLSKKKIKVLLDQWRKEGFDISEFIPNELLEPTITNFQDNKKATISVVIPCKNYNNFLPHTLNSLKYSTLKPVRVLVIDDNSDEPEVTEKISKEFGAEYYRVEYNSCYKTRIFGVNKINEKYVLTLDADNLVYPDYIQNAVNKLESDRNMAFVFPVLEAFGEKTGFMYNTENAPQIVVARDIELVNKCDSNSIYRTDIFRQNITNNKVPNLVHADWFLFRNILRDSAWFGYKNEIPLRYRVHNSQLSVGHRTKDYYTAANLALENVTIIIAFSGRMNIWTTKILPWIKRQSWPRDQTKIKILNSSHKFLTYKDFGLDDEFFKSIDIEKIDVGESGLADENRQASVNIRERVETAVSSLYNYAISSSTGEYLFFLEDDVEPHHANTIEKLMKEMKWDICGVSGAYIHRYDQNKLVGFTDVGMQGTILCNKKGPKVQNILGSGFGCLLARKSILDQYGLSGDDHNKPHYDVDLGIRLSSSNPRLRWVLNREASCSHHITNEIELR